MTNIGKQTVPGAGLETQHGGPPDPRSGTWHEWLRVSRNQYIHYMSLPLDAPEVAHRHHANATAGLVPHLIAQLEYSWQQIEIWVKWWRDQYDADHYDGFVAHQAIDAMLDDLRDHLATGTSLHQECGPNTESNEEDRWTP